MDYIYKKVLLNPGRNWTCLLAGLPTCLLAECLRTLGDFGGASVIGVLGNTQEDVLQRVSVQVPHGQGRWGHAWEEKNTSGEKQHATSAKSQFVMTAGVASARQG